MKKNFKNFIYIIIIFFLVILTERCELDTKAVSFTKIFMKVVQD